MTFKYGDIVLANLNPIAGHEQGNMRPVLVINKYPLLGHVNVIVPITTSPQKFVFTIPLDQRTTTQGNILCYQIRTLDLNDFRRNAKLLETAPDDIVEKCIEEVQRLMGVFD